VRNRYLELAKAEPRRVRVIDAAQPLPEIRKALERNLADL